MELLFRVAGKRNRFLRGLLTMVELVKVYESIYKENARVESNMGI